MTWQVRIEMVSLESQTPEHLTDTFRRQRCVGTRILEARGPVNGTSDEPGSWTGRGFHVRHVKSVVSTGRLPGEQIPSVRGKGASRVMWPLIPLRRGLLPHLRPWAEFTARHASSHSCVEQPEFFARFFSRRAEIHLLQISAF